MSDVGAGGPTSDPGPAPPGGSLVARALLLGAGLVLLGAGALYNEWTLSPLADGAFRPLTLSKIRSVQAGFLVAGLVLVALSEAVRRVPAVARRARGRAVATGLLVLAGILPLLVVDFGLRPFVDAKTGIFVPDPELGWRLAPGARGEWGGVRVAINGDGMRGPRVATARRPGAARLLFLGDSVTFGYGVAETDAVFPWRTAAALERDLGRPVEVVNAAVGGWSPWQQLAWLECCGQRYAPDAIVLGFVLNDVTEPLSLVRYGGTGSGWQLARSARSAVDRWLSGSALVTLAREGAARLRFGADVQLGARRAESRDVRRLIARPEAFERAWRIALESLDRIADLAELRGTPLLLVVFPYAFQLEGEASPDPQRRLAHFAASRDLPMLDLLPVLREVGTSAFLDPSHLSAEGHARVGREIARRLRELGWLSAPRRTDG